MEPVNRREFAAMAAVPFITGTSSFLQSGDSGGRFVSMHGASSSFDFRTMMEGWARAGIRAVEPYLG